MRKLSMERWFTKEALRNLFEISLLRADSELQEQAFQIADLVVLQVNEKQKLLDNYTHQSPFLKHLVTLKIHSTEISDCTSKMSPSDRKFSNSEDLSVETWPRRATPRRMSALLAMGKMQRIILDDTTAVGAEAFSETEDF